mgnify:CR=1 FL=1
MFFLKKRDVIFSQGKNIQVIRRIDPVLSGKAARHLQNIYLEKEEFLRELSQMEQKNIELDVREDIRAKKDPFNKIMDTIKNFTAGDQLVLHAPFKPEPLLRVLKGKGFEHSLEEVQADHWIVTFTKIEE